MTVKEVKQLHDRVCFKPVKIQDLLVNEQCKVMIRLKYLTKKCDGSSKGRLVYNRKPTRAWIEKDEAEPNRMHHVTVPKSCKKSGHRDRRASH